MSSRFWGAEQSIMVHAEPSAQLDLGRKLVSRGMLFKRPRQPRASATARRDDLARAGPVGGRLRSTRGSTGSRRKWRAFRQGNRKGEGPRQLVAESAFSNGRRTSSAGETRPNEGATRRIELVSPDPDPTMNGPRTRIVDRNNPTEKPPPRPEAADFSEEKKTGQPTVDQATAS